MVVVCERLQRGQGVHGEVGSVMRMNAGRGKQYAGVRARKADSLPGAFFAGSRHDDLDNADGRGSLQDGGTVVIEAVVGEVGADVRNQFHGGKILGLVASGCVSQSTYAG